MAVKQEIKYKVRKIDGTYGEEGKIVLNAIKDGARYLVHRAVVAQANKKRQGTSSTKIRCEVAGGGNESESLAVHHEELAHRATRQFLFLVLQLL
jgi:ribosomal protein L4